MTAPSNKSSGDGEAPTAASSSGGGDIDASMPPPPAVTRASAPTSSSGTSSAGNSASSLPRVSPLVGGGRRIASQTGIPPPPTVFASGAPIPSFSNQSASASARPTTPGAGSGGGGIPPILGRQRSLSHGQSPLSSPSTRHRIALGAPVPTAPYNSQQSGVGSGSLSVPFLPNLNPATPPCTPVPPVGVPVHTIPGGGTLPGTPSRARSKAVEHALEAERSRIKDLEAREKDMDVAGLRVALKRERQHSSRLAADLAALWSSAVQSQADAEVHEENRINGLMRRLDRLQREKGRIIVELEREEEMLTNTLQKKLNEVRREKALLEKQIEREHEEQARLARRKQEAHVTRSVSTGAPADAAGSGSDGGRLTRATSRGSGVSMDVSEGGSAS